MTRGSNAVSGHVRFPIDDHAWRNDNSGGMVVKLVICDNRDKSNSFGMCSGAYVNDLMTNPLVGDDQRAHPDFLNEHSSSAEIEAENRAVEAWEAYHFPSLHDEKADFDIKYLSRDYLATIVVGSAGWSGWSDTENRYWECRVEDLTEEGRALYHQMEALFPGCVLHLLTFLDT